MDPALLFDKSYERMIANYILSYQNVVLPYANYDERIVQKHIIDRLQVKKEVLVLGSSPSMQIDSNLFPGKSFFNNSVSESTLEDYLAIYNLYFQKGFTPSVVILELPPFIFNKNSGFDQWFSLEANFKDMLRILKVDYDFSYKMGNISHLLRKYINIISFSYFQTSVKMFLSKGKIKKICYPTNKKLLDKTILCKDGRRIYQRSYQLNGEKEVLELCKLTINPNAKNGLQDYGELDPNLTAIFVKFVNWLKQNNIKLIFFLSPYHPYVYNKLTSLPKYKMIHNTQKYIEEIADKKNIMVLGSYNPFDLGLKNSDFLDGVHPRYLAIQKYLTRNVHILYSDI